MSNKIEDAISELQDLWKNLNMESVYKIRAILQSLARDKDVNQKLQIETRDLPKGLELYRDTTEGFVLLAYSEGQGTYRIPHNHGSAWVVYAVVSGEVEMGNYFDASRASGPSRLILKNREILNTGDTRIYLPGEIHDTRCMSENAIILRLTSLDLKVEERDGRMKRYQL